MYYLVVCLLYMLLRKTLIDYYFFLHILFEHALL